MKLALYAIVTALMGILACGSLKLCSEEKEKRKKTEEKFENYRGDAKKYAEKRKESEGRLNRLDGVPGTGSFNDSVELMQNLSERGKRRNS